MKRVLVVNGSPSRDQGTTGLVLSAFVRGLEEAGACVEVVYPSAMDIEPCDCGKMLCWLKKPGDCYHRDSMDEVMPRLKAAEIVVLATPVYIPLPGVMQEFVNRMTPLLEPVLETREGRTRARIRHGVAMRQMVLVATGAWWERENLDTVERIVRELAEDASVEFSGAILRPHAHLLLSADSRTQDGEAVLEEVAEAGYQLIATGKMNQDLLAGISRPLIAREELLRRMSL
jgi:multimeric flavodoxin WrbA